MKNLLISVIIPVYNTEKYLEKCLNSIVNQSFKNLEIIIINDGSTDCSPNIINEFAKKDSRIKVIDKTNGGIGSAYKVALNNVNGDYISFVDSDDYLDINAYEELTDIVLKEDPDFVHFGLTTLNANGIKSDISYHKTLNETVFENEQILINQFEKLKQPSLAKLFKSNLFNNIVIFDQNVGIDEMLTPQLLIKSHKAVYTSKSLYYVHERAESVCRAKYTEEKIKEIIKVYRFLCSFMEKNKPKYVKYIQIKYLNILVMIYNMYIDNKKFLSKETLFKVKKDLYIHYSKVKSTNIFKEKSLRYKLNTFFILFIPNIYNLLYNTIRGSKKTLRLNYLIKI